MKKKKLAQEKVTTVEIIIIDDSSENETIETKAELKAELESLKKAELESLKIGCKVNDLVINDFLAMAAAECPGVYVCNSQMLQKKETDTLRWCSNVMGESRLGKVKLVLFPVNVKGDPGHWYMVIAALDSAHGFEAGFTVLDSTHNGKWWYIRVLQALKEYLKREFEDMARNGENYMPDWISGSFKRVTVVIPNVQQQENDVDCGVFTMHFGLSAMYGVRSLMDYHGVDMNKYREAIYQDLTGKILRNTLLLSSKPMVASRVPHKAAVIQLGF